MSCVTGVIVTTGNTFYTQHTRFNLPEEFGHAVDKYQSESKMKWTAAPLGNIQDFMVTISYQLSKWENIEHCHMTHYFWGEFGTYMGRHTKNKTIMNFLQGKRIASKKHVMSSKVASTSNSTKDLSQSRLSNELDILLITFGPAESTQDETRKINFNVYNA